MAQSRSGSSSTSDYKLDCVLTVHHKSQRQTSALGRIIGPANVVVEKMERLSLIPFWSALNRLGRNRLLRSSWVWLILVPVLAKFLLKIGPEIDIPLWDFTLTITLALPFSLKMLYFTAVSFAIASFIYSSRCPPIVRDYDRFSDFREEGKGGPQLISALFPLVFRPKLFINRTRQVLFVQSFLTKFDELSDDCHAEDDQQSTLYERLSGAQIPEEEQANAFWAVRDYADRSSPLARLLCGIFYLSAFAFAFRVLWQNFLYVCGGLSARTDRWGSRQSDVMTWIIGAQAAPTFTSLIDEPPEGDNAVARESAHAHRARARTTTGWHDGVDTFRTDDNNVRQSEIDRGANDDS